MKECEKVYSELNKLNIPFEIIEHPAVTTTEEADKYVEGIEGVLSKSLFLTNDKKTAYYLLIMDDRDKLDMNKFKEKNSVLKKIYPKKWGYSRELFQFLDL